MGVINKKVKHKSKLIGIGTIVREEKNKFWVDFENGKEICFLYPDAFKEGHLSFIDKENESLIHSDIEARKSYLDNRNDINHIKGSLHRLHKKNVGEVVKFYSVHDFIDCYTDSLTKEIEYLKKSQNQKRYLLQNGKCVLKQGIKKVYLFETEEELFFPNGTKIQLHIIGEKLSGTVISCDESTILFSATKINDFYLEKLEITSESWALLKSLNEHLIKLKFRHNDISNTLMVNANIFKQHSNEIIVGQEATMDFACSNPITFIWGPPGTGKTHTLANISKRLLDNRKRILMVSYSNVSVDNAIMSLKKLCDSEYIEQHKIVRYGYPREIELLNNEDLTSYNIALKKNPEIKKKRDELLELENAASESPKTYSQIKTALAKIRDILAEEEKQIVKKASFVATTISKAIVDKTIYEQSFDMVIFDEASMAYIPQIVFAASLAKSHFCCIGDFCQLPPIVQSNTSKHLLEMDIFKFVDIPRDDHPWLAILDVQRRMHPKIADFISNVIYEGILKSHNDIKEKQIANVALAPIKNSPVVMLDTSCVDSVCCTVFGGSSHYNLLSAFICAYTLLQIINSSKTATVGIITPYSAQAKLTKSIISEFITDEDNHRASCATVHQFQGSERDFIIYDSVDTFVQSYPGILLTQTDNNTANRLFNVAMSRAKAKFVVVTDCDYMSERLANDDLAFKNFIRTYSGTNNAKDVSYYLCDTVAFNDDLKFYTSTEEAKDTYYQDMSNAKIEVRIDIPKNMCEHAVFDERFIEAITDAEYDTEKLFIRANKKSKLITKLKRLVDGTEYVYNPISIFDKKVVWYGIPVKNEHSYSQLYCRCNNENIVKRVMTLLQI